MSKWYYSVDGRAEGPVEDAVIIENLKSGKLTLVDLVFREGDDGWRTIGEVAPFKDAFAKVNLPPNPTSSPGPENKPEPPPVGSDAAPFVIPQVTGDGQFRFQPNPELTWVILTKISGRGDDRFHQSGPYSAEQIEAMLARGECKYSDYVWRPGYRKWARLGNLPEFDRRRKSRDGDRVPEAVPLPKVEIESTVDKKEFLQTLMRTQTDAPLPRVAEPPPPETDGRDFTEITAPQFDVEAAQRELDARITAAQMDLEAKVSASVNMPPPVGNRDIPIDVTRSEPPPSVPDAPPPMARTESVKTVVYGSVRVGGAAQDDGRTFVHGSGSASAAAQDDGKTVVFARPPGSDPMAPPLDIPLPPKFDPDATMVQMSAAGMAQQQPVAQGEGIFVEDAPARFQRFQKPLIAAAVMLVLVVVGLQTLDLSTDPVNDPVAEASAEVGKPDPVPRTAAVPKPRLKPADSVVAPPKPVVTLPPAAVATPAPVAELNATPAPPDEPPVNVSKIRAIAPGTGKVTVLDLVPVRTDGVRTQFAVNTNAAVGSNIYISLLARSGDVLKYPSFYTTASVTRANGEIPTFDFTNLHLPPGQYRVEVAAGEMRKARAVFIGNKNNDFEASMEKHLKDISFQQQTEKKALFHSARLMEALAKALGESYFESRTDARKWRTFYLNWQRDVLKARRLLVDRVAPERRNELAYPDEIIALKIAVTKLIDQADALNDSILSNTQARDVAGAGNLAIVKEFSRIRSLAATISSRKQ